MGWTGRGCSGGDAARLVGHSVVPVVLVLPPSHAEPLRRADGVRGTGRGSETRHHPRVCECESSGASLEECNARVHTEGGKALRRAPRRWAGGARACHTFPITSPAKLLRFLFLKTWGRRAVVNAGALRVSAGAADASVRRRAAQRRVCVHLVVQKVVGEPPTLLPEETLRGAGGGRRASGEGQRGAGGEVRRGRAVGTAQSSGERAHQKARGNEN